MDAIGLVGLMSSRFQRLLHDHAMIEASITALRPRQCGVSSMSSGRARPSLAGSLPIKGDHCLSKQNVSGCRESTRRTSVAQDRSALKVKRTFEKAEMVLHLFHYLRGHRPDTHRINTMKSSLFAWIGWLMRAKIPLVLQCRH